ncbi:flippase-like domain-containing protein [Blastopirellula sp. J2-11]|uniref:lysylphosphatidylglycerol synthase transmembrane domain-containing protein n=1 Tax=Blastopirellula sp. J2-11 TaxID=2943192 RepID=UPI0021CA49FF|nr:lysylphosphatidylglycerol synthase transmembrane domain-containing protein [Blastopirellula sp. J2-11]UUO06154.1 flippase-like domain-containing protein [Blastopirellula sp. J2-11]
MKKTLLTLLKFAVPAGILTYLIRDLVVNHGAELQQIRDSPKNWGLLTLAFALAMTALICTFLRWRLLVVTLQMPFRVTDALRLGFLGFLFNFVGAGSVGGDLFKAIFIAREYPQNRAAAFATVVVDRMIGLYALLVVTSLATLAIDRTIADTAMLTVLNIIYGLTIAGGLGVGMILLPGFTRGSVSEILRNLPKVGSKIGNLIDAVRLYRRQPLVLTVIAVMSLSIHGLFAMSVYCIAHGLFTDVPTLLEHLVIVPLSMVFAALPIAPGGMGTFELAMNYLYQHVPTPPAAEGIGTIVALGYRVITILMALVGVVYYWFYRKEVGVLMHEAEEEQEHEHDQPAYVDIPTESATTE